MKNLSIVWSLVIMAAFGVAVFIFSSSGRTGESLLESPTAYLSIATTTKASPNLAAAIAVPDDPPAGYVKYENEKYGFYYYHSPESTIKEYDEGGGAMTVVQENPEKARGLQIFIVPYGEKQITEERFRRDIPSGVRYNVEETTIGKKGVPAVTFNSRDQFLGETREVWFIYNGYLFEVTTFKGFGEWFAPIMQTWRFTN